MTASTATAVEAGRNCPYCRFPLKAGVPVEHCSTCDSVYHDECWRDCGGCAVFGCAGAGTAVRLMAVPGVQQAPPNFPPPSGPPSAGPPPARPNGSANPQRAALIAAIAVLAILVAALGGYVLTSSNGKEVPTASKAAKPVAPPESTTENVEDTRTAEPTAASTVDPQVTAKRAARRIETIIAFSQAGRAAVRDGRYADAVSNRRTVLRRLRAIKGTTGRLKTAKQTLEKAMQASLASDIAYQNGTSATTSDAEATRLKEAFARQWASVANTHNLSQYSPGDI